MRVKHATFGVGTVLSVEPGGQLFHKIRVAPAKRVLNLVVG